MTTLQVQEALMSLGFSITMLDGIQGPETTQAIKDFQYTWGSLDIDGIVGPMTTSALNEAIELLMRGQWNVAMDPQQYITSGLVYEPAPPTTIYPSSIEQIITGQPQPTGQPTTLEASLGLSNLGNIGGIDWTWILIGVGIVMVIFQLSDKSSEPSKRKRK